MLFTFDSLRTLAALERVPSIRLRHAMPKACEALRMPRTLNKMHSLTEVGTNADHLKSHPTSMSEDSGVRADVRAALDALFRDAEGANAALSDAEDPAAFAAQMVRETEERDDSGESIMVSASQVVTAFPRAARFVNQLAVVIATWFESERCPLLDQTPAAEGVNVLTDSRDRMLELPLSTLQAFVSSCGDMREDDIATQRERVSSTAAFILALGGARGILTCLGFRETVGSRTVAPLTRAECLVSFQQLQSTKEKLTVGARAFTKHCARSSSGFWGEFKGNDRQKNATALAKVEYILDNAVWKNVHSLPHGEVTFELRDVQGYGARWYIRDQSFRGFLEPHMENGHENRWRH